MGVGTPVGLELNMMCIAVLVTMHKLVHEPHGSVTLGNGLDISLLPLFSLIERRLTHRCMHSHEHIHVIHACTSLNIFKHLLGNPSVVLKPLEIYYLLEKTKPFSFPVV